MNLTIQHDKVVEAHTKRLEGLKKLIRRGDWQKVSEKTGLQSSYAQHLFSRVTAEKHLLVVSALEEVIEERVAKFKVG